MIWKLQVQQRVKTFIWKLAHDKILTNYGQWRRKMTDSLACFRCNCNMEDALHTLSDCPSSKEVWMKTGLVAIIPNFFFLSLKDWVLNCLSCIETQRWKEDGHRGCPSRCGIYGSGETMRYLEVGHYLYNSVLSSVTGAGKRPSWRAGGRRL